MYSFWSGLFETCNFSLWSTSTGSSSCFHLSALSLSMRPCLSSLVAVMTKWHDRKLRHGRCRRQKAGPLTTDHSMLLRQRLIQRRIRRSPSRWYKSVFSFVVRQRVHAEWEENTAMSKNNKKPIYVSVHLLKVKNTTACIYPYYFFISPS